MWGLGEGELRPQRPSLNPFSAHTLAGLLTLFSPLLRCMAGILRTSGPLPKRRLLGSAWEGPSPGGVQFPLRLPWSSWNTDRAVVPGAAVRLGLGQGIWLCCTGGTEAIH